MKKCECETPTITGKEQTNYMYILCEKCGGYTERKKEICSRFNMKGTCDYATAMNFEIKCTVNGDWTKCATAKRLFHKEEK